ncbi:hypothetical protein [Devosia ginsengisoli]|uniref:Uncharacterized protein n=1 Tax=Devosia ginsengisoli TaxID=400770 RepID=A0A5B8LSC0_9HYPH|nr:hypothetical protein [Devosia ginsengisoli]QDZ10554.1 hypothetical protein FPZ08_07190 [Devosia ginsengisoli]
MIDHYEQGAQQQLIDELEAVSPSLATWAFAEFDAGATARSIRSIIFAADMGGVGQVVSQAGDLVQAVTFDDSGNMGKGGNGGLLSRETIRKADTLRLTLNDINKLLPAGSRKG